MVLWGYPSLIYSQAGNQKSNSEIYQLEFVKQVVSRWFKGWQKSVCWVCVFTQKGHTLDTLPYSQLCCLPYWFAEEHNCVMHPYITESHNVKYAGLFTLTYSIDTISLCVHVFHCHYQWIYWRRILPKSKLSWWLWGNGIQCNTIDSREEPSLFTLKTNMPIPMLVYGDSFQWEKYDILPSSLDLASNNKGSLHRTFWNSLIEFLRTDLDGNLSSNLSPQISSKLDHYLSRLFEGLSETGSKGKMFDQHLLNEKCNNQFVEEIVDIALDATQIPLSIITNLFLQRFEKHSMLESMLEILQQFYI